MNKFRKILLISFFVCLIFGAGTVSAQEENNSLEYVIQPGDTLTSIAVRFGITLEELTDVNGISNPNQVYVGDVLIIPGVDWVSGRLDIIDVPIGETFRSVRRRYQLTPQVIGTVSGIVSPSQVYAEYPLMIPSGIGEDWNAGRAVLSAETSLLGMAAETGNNPWMLAYKNQLSGMWTGISSDVMLLPGTNDPGPGALPSPLSVSLRAGEFNQGATVVLEVNTGEQDVSLSGEFIGKPLHFFKEPDGSYVALQGIHAMIEPAPYMLTLAGAFGEGNSFEFSQLVKVRSGGYDSEKITVDPLYLDSVVNQAESDFVAGLTVDATNEKLWSGVFEKPTPFDIFINSSFGTRRSYNGSEYSYFHTGVDFGGGEGAEVICPAAGKVVFTGALEVRGYATIIDHGWGVYTGYWHQSEIFVQVGDTVSPGQIIGLVGNTGRSSGAHLHWELWVGGVQVEPLDWLNRVYP